MKEKFIEASQLPENEKVYLQKDFLGWRVVEPVFIDGKFIPKNLFTKKSLVVLFIILFFSVIFYFGINNLIDSYRDIAENPCDYCIDCTTYSNRLDDQTFEISFEGVENYG